MKSKATDDEIVKALKKHNGIRVAAAREIGMAARSLQARIDTMKGKGIDIPESTYGNITGRSTLLGADGEVKLTWVKESAGQLSPEKIADAIREALLGVPPAKTIPAAKAPLGDLLTVYPIGDAHLGMYAWAEEAGEDYDLKIAEGLHTSAMRHLVRVSPASKRAIVLDVGDFTHYDNIKGETARSHNTLDFDSRFHAMIRCTLRVADAMIQAAAEKHEEVWVYCVPGNHNDMGAAWMVESLAMHYRKNPRIKVIAKAGKFFYHEFGKVLLGMTHGDTGKPEKLAGVMPVDMPEAWGRTKHKHWLTGHVHHKSQLELVGTTWETFRTLAPRDAWAQGAGYRAGRDMQSIVYHREHGEVARHRFDPAMLESA